MINKIFNTLDKWRTFPAYQLERRADIFFAVYLEKILQERFKSKISKILPEFPVRIGDLKNNEDNKSYKIDYLAISEESNTVYFVELKTDLYSKREKQDRYLTAAKKNKIPKLIDGIIKIYEATNSKKKYLNYLKELIDVGWINEDSEGFKNNSNDYNITIVYIQPTCGKEGPKEEEIYFDDIIAYFKDEKDEFTKRFCESLERWKVNPVKIKI